MYGTLAGVIRSNSFDPPSAIASNLNACSGGKGLASVAPAFVAPNNDPRFDAPGNRPVSAFAAAGSATVDAQEVSELEIDWVSGSVRVEAGSEDTVVFEESMASGAVAAEDALQWRLNRGTLQIVFCTRRQNHEFFSNVR